MPDLKGTVITLHCLIHINVIQLQQDDEYRKHHLGCWSGKITIKKKEMYDYIKSLTFIMFLKTYACVLVLLSLFGLQIIQ